MKQIKISFAIITTFLNTSNIFAVNNNSIEWQIVNNRKLELRKIINQQQELINKYKDNLTLLQQPDDAYVALKLGFIEWIYDYYGKDLNVDQEKASLYIYDYMSEIESNTQKDFHGLENEINRDLARVYEVIAFFLHNGANVNYKKPGDPYNNLYIALKYRLFALATIFLKYDANIDITIINNLIGNEEISDFLIQNTAYEIINNF